VFYHYFAHTQTLFFTFSPRRRQRRRQQYEVFQKIFSETSLSNTKMFLFITSIRHNRMIQLIDTRHLHSLFASFSSFFDLNDDTSYETRKKTKKSITRAFRILFRGVLIENEAIRLRKNETKKNEDVMLKKMTAKTKKSVAAEKSEFTRKRLLCKKESEKKTKQSKN
jgi:hypothetical protein